ncbi:hypothetical protein NL676_033580 [Syzygium grande]|nr:hypothetical protein NL676_033580 [Syzygium grande]
MREKEKLLKKRREGRPLTEGSRTLTERRDSLPRGHEKSDSHQCRRFASVQWRNWVRGDDKAAQVSAQEIETAQHQPKAAASLPVESYVVERGKAGLKQEITFICMRVIYMCTYNSYCCRRSRK